MGFLFCNHFTFYLSYLGMNYSNVIGFLLSIVFLLQFLSGLLLALGYVGFSLNYGSIVLLFEWNSSFMVRSFHVFLASSFMLLILTHWMRGLWYSLKLIEQIDINNISHSISFNLIWFSGLMILLFTFLTSFIGYCVCWGQMSYWGITVMINILTIMPLFGSYIGSWFWCSSLWMVNSLFMLHFLLGFMISLLMLCHLILLHNFSSCNPLMNNYSSFLLCFVLLFFKDLFVSCWIPLFMSFYLFWDPDMFGNADNLITANPLSTPTHILPEWYFNMYFCMLSAFPNKVLGVIVTAGTMFFILFL